MAMIEVRARWALGIVGTRKSGTPLLTASTPVIAVHPFANARTRIHRVAACVAAAIGGRAATGVGWPPLAIALTTPTTTTMTSVTTNTYVGTMNARPDSRMPRRLTRVSTARMTRHRARV